MLIRDSSTGKAEIDTIALKFQTSIPSHTLLKETRRFFETSRSMDIVFENRKGEETFNNQRRI